MRSLNSLRNLIVSLLYELLVVAFGLFVPRLIIGTYGNDVNGLSSTVNQVLQIMNLQLIVKGISEKHNKKYQIT